MARRARKRVAGAIGRRLVRIERVLVQTAMVPIIAVADRRITRSIGRQA
jgi:hypothetical protein